MCGTAGGKTLQVRWDEIGPDISGREQYKKHVVMPEIRISFTDKKAARKTVETILDWDFDRIVLAHGPMVSPGPLDRLVVRWRHHGLLGRCRPVGGGDNSAAGKPLEQDLGRSVVFDAKFETRSLSAHPGHLCLTGETGHQMDPQDLANPQRGLRFHLDSTGTYVDGCGFQIGAVDFHCSSFARMLADVGIDLGTEGIQSSQFAMMSQILDTSGADKSTRGDGSAGGQYPFNSGRLAAATGHFQVQLFSGFQFFLGAEE